MASRSRVVGKIKETQLRGGEVIVGRSIDDGLELLARVGARRGRFFLRHAEQQVGQFAVQRCVSRVQFEGLAEFVDVGIAVGQLLAGDFGGARFAAAGRCQKRGHHAFGIAARFFDAGQFEQHGFALGQKLNAAR